MDRTIAYYESHAEAFILSTKTAPMESLRARFLETVPRGGHILDFGCGSGRDAKAFKELGYEVSATDGSEKLSSYASAFAGITVRHERFQQLEDDALYDGIWACSSILHLTYSELPLMFTRLGRALKPGGVLYASFKHGSFEGERDGRHFTDLTEERAKAVFPPTLSVISLWTTYDTRPGRSGGKWLNCLLRKTSQV